MASLISPTRQGLQVPKEVVHPDQFGEATVAQKRDAVLAEEAVSGELEGARVPVRPEMVSVYVRPEVLLRLLPDIAAKGCDELWLNPGTESAEVLESANELGLNVIQACSILGVGLSPSQL